MTLDERISDMPDLPPKTESQTVNSEASKPMAPPFPPASEWALSLRTKAETIPGRQGEIARTLVSDELLNIYRPYITSSGYASVPRDRKRQLLADLGWREGVNIEEMLNPEGDLYQAVAALIGGEGAEFARKYWRRNLELAKYLARGNIRSPDSAPTRGDSPFANVRSKKLGSLRIIGQLDKLREVLMAFAEDPHPQERVEELFAANAAGDSNVPVRREASFNLPSLEFVGQCLDDDAEGRLLDLLTGMIKRDRNRVSPTSGTASLGAQFSSILAGSNPRGRALLVDLIADPELCEEQRIDLLQRSELYAPDGFAAMLAALDQAPESVRNSPAVTNVLADFLGLNKEAVLHKNETQPDYLSLMAAGLGDSARREAMFSQGAAEVYTALWALSRLELADCLDKIRKFVASGSDIQKEVALFFTANQIRISQYQWQITRPVLADPGVWKGLRDSTNLVLVVHCLEWFADGGRLHLQDTSGHEPLSIESKGLFLTRDETLELYLNLRKIVDHLIAGGKSANGFGGRMAIGWDFWGWVSRHEVFTIMINLAAREIIEKRTPFGQVKEPGVFEKIAADWGFPEKVNPMPAFLTGKPDALDDNFGTLNIRDNLCIYLDEMEDRDNRTKYELLDKIVTDGSHSLVQHLIFMQMFPGSMRYAEKVELTDDEYAQVEEKLAGSTPARRVALFPLFLRRDPAGLEKSLQRLLTDPNPTAGRELLAIVAKRKDDPVYHDLYRNCAALAGGEEDNHQEIVEAHAADETNGYGDLYDASLPPARFPLPSAPDLNSADAGKKLFGVTLEEILTLLQAVDQTIAANASVPYRAQLYSGKHADLTIGDPSGLYPEYRPQPNATNPAERASVNTYPIPRPRYGKPRLDDFPIAPVWRAMLAEVKTSPACLVFLVWTGNFYAFNACQFTDGVAWLDYAKNLVEDAKDFWQKSPYQSINLGALNEAFMNEMPSEACYAVFRNLILALMTLEPLPHNMNVTLTTLMSYLAHTTESNDANFSERFRIACEYQYGPNAKAPAMELIWPEDLVRAYRLGVLPENDFIRVFIAWARNHPNWFERFIDPRTREILLANAPGLAAIVDRIGARAMELEAKSGAVPTKLSALAAICKRYSEPPPKLPSGIIPLLKNPMRSEEQTAMPESVNNVLNFRFDPLAPEKSFGLGPDLIIGNAHEGGDVFPVTAADLQPLVDIADAVVAERKNNPAATKTLRQAFQEKVAALPVLPATRVLAGVIFKFWLLPGSQLSVRGSDGKSVSIQTVIPWLKYVDDLRNETRRYASIKRFGGEHLEELFNSLYDAIPPAQRYPTVRNLVRAFMAIDSEPEAQDFQLAEWLPLLKQCAGDNAENRTDFFKVAYEANQATGWHRRYLLGDALDIGSIVRVWRLGVLPTNDCLRLLMQRGLTDSVARGALARECPEIMPALDRSVEEVVQTEIHRGEEATPVTSIAAQLGYFRGAKYFADIIAALGNLPIEDSGVKYRDKNDKDAVLSLLLQACYPASGDDAETLGRLLTERNIPRDMVAMAVRRAPQWKAITEDYLNPGRKEKPPTLSSTHSAAVPGEPLPENALLDRSAKLEGKQREAAEAILDRLRHVLDGKSSGGIGFNEKGDRPILQLLGWSNELAITDVFRPGNAVYEAVAEMAGQENAALLRRMWERAAEHPWLVKRWTDGRQNPRFRSETLGCLYIGGHIEMFYGFLGALATGFSLEKFIVKPGRWDRDREMFVQDLLAVRMDEGEDADRIFAQIKNTVQEMVDSHTFDVQCGIRDLAGALARSRRPEAWRFLADLIFTPMLPESYRVDILDVANQGTYGALKAILTDRRLFDSPFAGSREAAVISWFGMDTVIDGVFWGEQGYELVRDCLTWIEKGREDIMASILRESCDETSAYLALWAQSQWDLDDALATCRRLLTEGSRDQKLSALFWLTRLRNVTLQMQLLLPVLENRENWNDGLVMALAFHCLGINDYQYTYPNDSGRGRYPVMLTEKPDARSPNMHIALFCSEPELLRLQNLVHEYADTLDGSEKRPYGGRLWVFYHWFNFLFFKQDVLNLYQALLRK